MPTAFMLLATALHRDGFERAHFPFQLWLVLYAITPFLVPFLWLRNRRADPGTPEPDDAAVPGAARARLGATGAAYAFTAAVGSTSTVLPVTYTWSAASQAPVVHTGGLTDTVTYTWTAPGLQVITVTAANSLGQVGGVHVIDVLEPVAGLAAANDGPTPLGDSTTFTATVTAGTYAAYAWDFRDGTSGSGAVAAHVYASTGTYAATVTAANGLGSQQAQTGVEVVQPGYAIYLPVVRKE